MFKRLTDRALEMAAHRRANWVLAVVSFIESSVFPVPPDALLIPMVLAKRTDWLKIATICTIASVLGGLLGYGIGYFAFESVGRPVLDLYGKEEAFHTFQQGFNEHGWLWVFGAGLTPFPYKVITLTSGLTQLYLPTFIAASVVARGIRFYLVAFLIFRFGEPVRGFIERRGWLVTTLLFVGILAVFLLVRAVL